MRAFKPTEGQGWTHVLCAVFTPEITFTDASRLRLVEGLNTVTRHKWSAVSFLYIVIIDCQRFIIEQKCFLCGEVEGAAIRCNDCNKEFHASCAWKQGHKFGFEIQPVSFVFRILETFILTSPSTRSRVVDEIQPPRLHLKANLVA